jgi:uncharacterized protein YaiL (DUF2058 family)
MKDDETSEKKSRVEFDESKNSVVEFLKHEKLKKDKALKDRKGDDGMMLAR